MEEERRCIGHRSPVLSKRHSGTGKGEKPGGLRHAARCLPKAYRSFDDDPSDQDKDPGPIEKPRLAQIHTGPDTDPDNLSRRTLFDIRWLSIIQ
jgi:hypothetical protein